MNGMPQFKVQVKDMIFTLEESADPKYPLKIFADIPFDESANAVKTIIIRRTAINAIMVGLEHTNNPDAYYQDQQGKIKDEPLYPQDASDEEKKKFDEGRTYQGGR